MKGSDIVKALGALQEQVEEFELRVDIPRVDEYMKVGLVLV